MISGQEKTISVWLHDLTDLFAKANLAQPRQEARLLLQAVLAIPLAEQLAHPERRLCAADAERLARAAESRARFCPVAYLAQEAFFLNHRFEVGPGVLIPRPETELLVEQAVRELNGRFQPGRKLQILDLCTGSGCVGISLALALQQAGYRIALTLTDVEPAALAYARRNVIRHALADCAQVLQADLWPPRRPDTAGSYDCIVANPPYVPRDELAELMPDVRLYEPVAALDGGADGLDFFRRLQAQAASFLSRPGLLLVEHGWNQSQAIHHLWQRWFETSPAISVTDYNGHARVLGCWLE